MPDILAAIEDISASPVAEGISNGGYVDLDPATITPEGMHLLQACFVNRELKMAEDKVCQGTLRILAVTFVHATPNLILSFCRLCICCIFVFN